MLEKSCNGRQNNNPRPNVAEVQVTIINKSDSSYY